MSVQVQSGKAMNRVSLDVFLRLNEFAGNPELKKFAFVKVNNESIIFHGVGNDRPRLEGGAGVRGITPGRVEYNGFLSPTAKRKVKSMLTAWAGAMHEGRKLNSGRAGRSRVYPSFLTLTLPGVQLHDDNFIKRHYLGRFLKLIQSAPELRPAWARWSNRPSVAKYVGRSDYDFQPIEFWFWRAEAQRTKEGNAGKIHFHLILDKYIDKTAVKVLWNGILAGHGYDVSGILNGVRSELSAPSAWVETPRKSKRPGALGDYLVKYCLKNGVPCAVRGVDGRFFCDGQVDSAGFYVSGNLYRSISGRVWGCSDALRALRLPSVGIVDEGFEMVVSDVIQGFKACGTVSCFVQKGFAVLHFGRQINLLPIVGVLKSAHNRRNFERLYLSGVFTARGGVKREREKWKSYVQGVREWVFEDRRPFVRDSRGVTPISEALGLSKGVRGASLGVGSLCSQQIRLFEAV